MSALLKGIHKTTILAVTTLHLAACLPEVELSEQDPNLDDTPSFIETDGKSLSLPSTVLDYVSYADTNLPQHFLSGDNPVTHHDNTPDHNPISNAGATLGRVLFYDDALSINDAVSCASCHKQNTGFTDEAVLSEGFQGGLTGRHSMSLANNRFYGSGHFFWDERADTLEDQVLMPIQDEIEMGMTLDTLVIKLTQLDYYPELFFNAFGSEDITTERISLALAQFTRAMVSYQSKYDDALASASTSNISDNDLSHVLSHDEEAGRKLFELLPAEGGFGCGGCHSTVAQITNAPHNIGLDTTNMDEGAGNGEFKVPSLRNVEVSAPYMHDGRFEKLEDVINHYNNGIQDNPDLSPFLRNPVTGEPARFNMSKKEKHQLKAFLKALTDDHFLNSDLFSNPFQSDS